MKIIKVIEFSEFPVGRFYSDGPDSGERFREEILLPALKDNDVVTIDLNGTEGYGSSFLDEAFGGAVKKLNLSLDDANRRMILLGVDEYESFVTEIRSYINDACKSIAR